MLERPPQDTTPKTPRWWVVPLGLSATAAALGIAVLRPWHEPLTPAGMAAWVALQQATLVALIVVAWLAPRLAGLRLTVAARTAAVGIGLHLALSIWTNQLGAVREAFGGTLDTVVRTALAGTGVVVLVAVVAAIAWRHIRIDGHDATANADAAVAGAAVGLVVWEALTWRVTFAATTIAAIAVATVIVGAATAVVVRLMLSSSRAVGGVRLLGATLLFGTVALVTFARDALGGPPAHGPGWQLPVLLALATTAATALHPSTASPVGSERGTRAGGGTARAAVLAVAVMTPATVSLVHVMAAVRIPTATPGPASLSLPSAAGGVVITVAVAWRVVLLLRERDRTGRMLEHRSRHDALTGLPNRAHLLEELRHEIARVRTQPEHGDGPGLIFLDLDGFRAINDSYGHLAGDVVLVNVAQRLAGALRTDDVVGRTAGDEFVVLCRGAVDDSSLERFAERVRTIVEAPLPVEFGVVVPRVRIGVAMVDRGLAATDDAVSTVLRRADARMQRATPPADGSRPSPASRVVRRPRARGRTA